MTSQPDPRYASFHKRLFAYVLDCVILFAGLLVLQAVLYSINPVVAMQRDGVAFSGGQLHLWVFATATVPFLLYFASTIASRHQATLGMRWLKLRVQSDAGGRVSMIRALLRSAVLLIPFELNHTIMFQFAPSPGGEPAAALWIGVALVWLLIAVYIVTMLSSKRRQSIHDFVAGTFVVRSGTF